MLVLVVKVSIYIYVACEMYFSGSMTLCLIECILHWHFVVDVYVPQQCLCKTSFYVGFLNEQKCCSICMCLLSGHNDVDV